MKRYGCLLLCLLCSCTNDEEKPAAATEVELNFATSATRYLLGVFSTPKAEQVPNSSIAYTLSAGTKTGALMLRNWRGTHFEMSEGQQQVWHKNIEFENARHGMVEQIVDELRVGQRKVQDASAKQAGCGACGSQMCWQGACVSTVTLNFAKTGDITCDVLDVVNAGSTEINILLDQDDTASAAAVNSASPDFAATLARTWAALGVAAHNGALDRDGDGRMTVVFTNHVAGSVDLDKVGFFDVRDFLPGSDADATGNEADILWLRVPGTSNTAGVISDALAQGTFAHEYTHLVSYAKRVQARGNNALRESLWLDEGIAHTVEDLVGWGGSNVPTVATALAEWHDATFATDNDTVAQRGRAYLLLRNLIDAKAKVAGATTATAAATQTAAQQVLGELLDEAAVGFEHAQFKALGANFWNHLLAVYATGNSEVTETSAHAADFVAPAAHTSTTTLVGINTHSQFTDARGDLIDLSGPEVGDGTTEEIIDLSTPLESFLSESGAHYFLVSGFSGKVTIKLDPGSSAQSVLGIAATRIQ